MFNPFSFFQDETAVTVDDVKQAVDTKASIIILDVRTPQEYAQGHIAGSVLIPLQNLQQIVTKVTDKSKTVYAYCRSGARSAQAVSVLKSLGYTDVHTMSGGLITWSHKGYPLTTK